MPTPLLSALLFILLVHFMVPPPVASALDAPYLAELKGKARALKLSEQRNWHILLHYKKILLGGYKSRISDPGFFLSPAGRYDPEAELGATLAGFLQPQAPDGEHPICRYPARLQWLQEQLSIDPALLPQTLCSQQQELIRMVDARSAVLVFPVGHINSPASMFGHTLLRIDGSSKSNLISYAANYAADATDANGLVYAFKGLTGRYKGYYSLMPYYLKVKEYGDLEHRDIWEYRLKLSREEVDRMLLHTLELERISSDYYFLDENCSYNLLFLIEAARPGLHLTDRTGLTVLPTQTIEIAREAGILDDAVYRPSQGARMAKIASLLDGEGQQAALDLAQGRLDPAGISDSGYSGQRSSVILDLAAETLQLRFARKELDQDAYSKLYLKILAQRSLLGTGAEDPYVIEPPAPPDAGHKTSKIGLGGGVRRDDRYLQLSLQPSFHGLLDPDQGYIRGAQIKFLDAALCFDPGRDRLWLKTLHLLDIVSTAPRDRFFKPYSWKVATGWDTEVMANGRDSLIFRLNTGGGLAARSPWGGIAHAFAELDINAGRRFPGNIAAGPGLSFGTQEQLNRWWKMQLLGQAFFYILGEDRLALKGALAQNFRLARNSSLNLELGYGNTRGHSVPEATVLLNRYF